VLTDVICAPGQNREQVLKMIASLEHHPKHPLAATITNAAKREGISLAAVTEISERPGEGLNGIIHGKHLQITECCSQVRATCLPWPVL
jgi:cation transport ATPase